MGAVRGRAVCIERCTYGSEGGLLGGRPRALVGPEADFPKCDIVYSHHGHRKLDSYPTNIKVN